MTDKIFCAGSLSGPLVYFEPTLDYKNVGIPFHMWHNHVSITLKTLIKASLKNESQLNCKQQWRYIVTSVRYGRVRPGSLWFRHWWADAAYGSGGSGASVAHRHASARGGWRGLRFARPCRNSQSWWLQSQDVTTKERRKRDSRLDGAFWESCKTLVFGQHWPVTRSPLDPNSRKTGKHFTCYELLSHNFATGA